VRRRNAGDHAVGQALVALAAGDGLAARRHAHRARKNLGDTAQTLLLIAESARLAGREDEAAATYRALTEQEGAALLGLRGLFRQAMERQDWAEASELARRAEGAHPGGTWLREARLHLAARTGDWSSTLSLAGPDAPLATLATAAAEGEPDPEAALKLAQRAWKADPGFTPAALAYATRLRATGRENRAQDVARAAWKAQPHPDLARFALGLISDKLTRVKQGMAFVAANPDHAESHLLMARLSLDAGLTGEARRHLDVVRAEGLEERRVFLLLAELAETAGDNAAANAALRTAAEAPPDAAWICQACGAPHAAWHPACPACHTPGRVAWTPGMVRNRLAPPLATW
jgi:HemY protein